MTDETMYDQGLQIRREVLGAEHVDRALANASDFSRPMQEFVTEHCWGAVWSRPGLARRDRSIVNLAMLTAMGKSHELGVHVRGAITNGCTADEIREVIIQASIYCGMPAALEATRVAEATLKSLDD